MAQYPLEQPQTCPTAAVLTPPVKLKWTGRLDRYPIWPSEPDISIIRRISSRCLKALVPASENETILDALSVDFLAEGATHKVYTIRHPKLSQSYVFRVVIPVDPHLHTESEVATIKFVHTFTGIPVPAIVDWDSSLNNELGYEWTLMEKVQGVPLETVWRKMEWQSKVHLMEILAFYTWQLSRRSFNKIGSLYIDTKKQSSQAGPHVSLRWRKARLAVLAVVRLRGGLKAYQKDCFSRESLEGFSVGPMVKHCFFWDDQRFVPTKRGPFASELDWLQARLEACQAYIAATEHVHNTNLEISQDFRMQRYKPEKMSAIRHILRRCKDYLPRICQRTDRCKIQSGQSFSLYHSDLNKSNIMVDPRTLSITGIIDWEMIGVGPSWEALHYPELIDNQECEDGEEPPLPDYDREYDSDGDDADEGHNRIMIEKRDRWNDGRLRKEFDEAKSKYHLSGPIDKVGNIKRELVRGFNEFRHDWMRARHCIDKALDEFDSISESDDKSSQAPSDAETNASTIKDDSSVESPPSLPNSARNSPKEGSPSDLDDADDDTPKAGSPSDLLVPASGSFGEEKETGQVVEPSSARGIAIAKSSRKGITRRVSEPARLWPATPSEAQRAASIGEAVRGLKYGDTLRSHGTGHT